MTQKKRIGLTALLNVEIEKIDFLKDCVTMAVSYIEQKAESNKTDQ